MKAHHKTSVASRATVRSLIVACLPTVVVAWIANSPALGAAPDRASNTSAATTGNDAATNNAPPAKTPAQDKPPGNTNEDQITPSIHGVRG